MALSSCFTRQPKYNYDVFLSFRGKDTRYEFTGHLYSTLCQKGINTFIDEEELEGGQQISPTILNTIEESKISMIVFSENFASSTWCLDELVKIIECMKQQNQIVIPIFYKVEPSIIRHQTNSYGEAIAKHEKRFKDKMDKVQKWRSALFEASNLSGKEFKSGYEFQFIQMIVKEAFAKLNLKHLYLKVDNNLVGIESCMKKVNSLLSIETSKNSLIVGIYGPGGIGKTTLAHALHYSIVHQFEYSCFLANVREVYNKKGLLKLQKTLLAEIFCGKDVKFSDGHSGALIIKKRLQHKRVLLVLDDVDKLEQLEGLVGKCDWFGTGSRIIITTRNKHLLVAHQIEKTYQMKELNDSEALELFSLSAFKTRQPQSSYLKVSESIVHYAKGLPLALKVIGSDLFGKSLDEWECALYKYKRIPNGKLLEVLRISYDSLEEHEKNIFLDIACFFEWESLEYVEKILDACDFYPRLGIGVLVNKSLISIENDRLVMHDLIRDVGRAIDRQIAPTQPGKRSRLWFHEDVLEVLTQNTGTESVEGILLTLPKQELVHWDGTAFNNMKNLRILVIQNAIFSTGPEYLPNKLRLFEWNEYPSKTLPPNFHPKKLVSFNLPDSCITFDKPFMEFQFLTNMRFSGCKFLTQIPDVSGVPNIQYMNLSNCSNLVEVHDSVGFLSKLVELEASGCGNLKCFPRGILMASLRYLYFRECESLEFFPNILGKMQYLSWIDLSKTAIKELPDSFDNLTGLRSLDVQSCKYLGSLPSNLFMNPRFRDLDMKNCPQLVKSLTQVDVINNASLPDLTMANCSFSEDDLHMIFRCFPKLEVLILSGNNLESLPTCIKEAVHLRCLDVDDCRNLREIPEIPSNLEMITARNCISLSSESSGRLWSQAFKEVSHLFVSMPATKIPEWFDHCRKGEIVSFWIRQEFPTLAVAFVFENLDNLENEMSDSGVCSRCIQIVINSVEVKSRFDVSLIGGGHVVLFDLKDALFGGQQIGLNASLVHDWNHVEIFCMNTDPESPKMTVEYCGAYFYKQYTSMEDIRFDCPINLLKRPASFSSQRGTPKKLIKGAEENGKGELTNN